MLGPQWASSNGLSSTSIHTYSHRSHIHFHTPSSLAIAFHRLLTRAALAERERTPDTDADADTAPYGYGGRLTVDRSEPTRFRVFIEGRTIEFELAIVTRDTPEGRKLHAGSLGGEDEVDDYQSFEQNKVDFERFLNDESVVRDENLVLRWAGDKYVCNPPPVSSS